MLSLCDTFFWLLLVDRQKLQAFNFCLDFSFLFLLCTENSQAVTFIFRHL
jgi:hypothetical protein